MGEVASPQALSEPSAFALSGRTADRGIPFTAAAAVRHLATCSDCTGSVAKGVWLVRFAGN
jgi:hypothetical protein